MRKNHTQNLEFEIRVGQFTSENEFEPGFRHEHIAMVSRLRSRIEKNTESLPTWSILEPMYMMMRCEFDGGIRKTCRQKPQEGIATEEYMMKQRIGKVDIMTDRPYHFRASVSRETKLNMTSSHHMYKTVTQSPPKSIRYVLRASFIEAIPTIPGVFMGTRNNEPYSFQWDISKVSESGTTKKNAAEGQCSYHCEFELRNTLVPVEDKDVETQLNNTLVDLLIARIRAVSGSYIIEKSALQLPPEQANTVSLSVPLPPARLSLLVRDV
jgi:hypothetical protein